MLLKQTKLEKTLKNTQTELITVTKQLADPSTYTSRTRIEIDQLNTIHQNLEQQITQIEEDWLALEELLENCL